MQGVENTESSLIKPSPNSQHYQQQNYNVINIPTTNEINSSSISAQRHLAKNRNQLIYRSIQKGRQSRFEFQKFLYIDYCLLLFCFINVALSLLYYDADFVGKDNIARQCLILCNLVSIIQIIVTIIRYQVLIGLQKSQKILQQQQTLHSSGKIYQIILQIFIILIQPYSFFNNIKIRTSNIYDNFTFDYKINYILVVLGFAKIYIVIRVLLLRKIYMSPRSSRICRMYGCQSNYIYAIKCLFKDSPLTLIGLVFTTSIIIFAISLRIAERNLVYEYPKYFNGKQYNYELQTFQNALWLTIITMTTVGYGDYFPRTIFGRVIDVVLVVWGTFIVSLMVVVLTNTLNMDPSQKRALIVLNRLQTKKSLKQTAAFVITHCCRKFLIKKKVAKRLRSPLNDDEHIKLQSQFYKYLTNFQNIRRKIRSMYQNDDVYQEMTRQFQFINDEVSVLLASQQQTIISIHSHINQQRIRKNQQINILAKNKQSQQEQS